MKTTIVLTAAMLLACVPASASVLTLDDNGTHDLNYAVTQDNVEVENSTTANLLTGGSIRYDLSALDSSAVNVSGGHIVDDLFAYDASTVTVSGGEIGGDLRAVDDSTLTIFGTGFNEAGSILDYGDYFDTGGHGTIHYWRGTLADGTAFENLVYIYDEERVTLAAPATAVPEPSSIAMFGIGALGLLGYSRRRRQTSAAA